MAQKTKVFSITAVVFILCLNHASPSWAGKSLWELRGQTQTVEQESSQGETSQQTETKPQAPAQTAVQPTVKEAAPANTEVASFIESITIPSQYGRVKERFTGSDNRVFILMQEIHNHPEVYENTKEMMEIFLDQHQVRLILIEGDYGPIETPILRSQSKEWRESFAKRQMESGYFSGEDYLYMTYEPPPIVVGIDDEKFIKKRDTLLIHYKLLTENRSKVEAVFNQFKQIIESAKAKLYTPALKAFDVTAQEYLQDKISSEEFISILNQTLQDRGMTLSETMYPNMTLVVRGKETEEQDDFEKSQEYLQKVDHSKLFAEIKGLEKEIRSQLYKNPQEEKLDRMAKALYYLEKLSKISLIPLEWEEYIQDLAPFSVTDLVSFLKENGMSTSVTTQETEFLDQYRKEGETFYQLAIDREKIMVENSLKALDVYKVNKAILKTGGFHTAAIAQFLRFNSISYVVIAPRVTQPDMPTPYQGLLKESVENLNRSLQGAKPNL